MKSDKDKLIKFFENISESIDFRKSALEQIEFLKISNDRLAFSRPRLDGVDVRDNSIENISKNIIKISKDPVLFMFFIDKSAIHNIENKLKDGLLHDNSVELFGKENKDSLKILINSTVNEEARKALKTIRNYADHNKILHAVVESIDHIDSSLRSDNYSMVNKVIYEDTKNLINPNLGITGNQLYELLEKEIKENRVEMIKAYTDSYNAKDDGFNKSDKLDVITDRTAGLIRLRAMMDNVEVYERESTPQLIPSLKSAREVFENNVSLVEMNTKRKEKRNNSKSKMKM